MKIYIVTQGEYSDYHIITTFLDESIANDFVKAMNSKINGYSSNYSVEPHDVLSSIDEYKPNDELLEITYYSNDKSMRFDNECHGYEKIGRDIYFYNEGYYIAIIHTELTVKNVLVADKIMSEWVAQIEYELQNTFNGNLELYAEHYKKTKSETPF